MTSSRIDIVTHFTAENFARREAFAQDILDGLSAFQQGVTGFFCTTLCDGWVPIATQLDWARRGLTEGDEYGRSNALTYSKRAVCELIDSILIHHQMLVVLSKKYPKRIKALNQIGIDVPEVIHKLIIQPRNEAEHDYRVPSQNDAKDALEIAKLLVTALDKEVNHRPPVLYWPGLCYKSFSSPDSGVRFEITEIGDHPLFFADVFQSEPVAKIVHRNEEEICVCALDSFSFAEAVRLGTWLHSKPCNQGWPDSHFHKLKETLGL